MPATEKAPWLPEKHVAGVRQRLTRCLSFSFFFCAALSCSSSSSIGTTSSFFGGFTCLRAFQSSPCTGCRWKTPSFNWRKKNACCLLPSSITLRFCTVPTSHFFFGSFQCRSPVPVFSPLKILTNFAAHTPGESRLLAMLVVQSDFTRARGKISAQTRFTVSLVSVFRANMQGPGDTHPSYPPPFV